MRGLGRALALAVVLLAAVPFATPPPASALGSVAIYMGGLNWPIALAFSPDGRIFFAERITGQIRIIENDVLLPMPFCTLPNTATAGERGLLGLALDPGFPAVPWVYAYQTYNDAVSGTVYNRIIRIQAVGNQGLTVEQILRMPPLSGATNHNGGVIAFGPDGKLYAVVGENANIALAQDMMSPMGKVLRMNTDGSFPTDNPFYGNLSAHQLIYTFGHRNMFGLAFHPITGRAYVTENGPACNDEVNLLVAGGNFGWGTSQTCTTPPPPPNNTNQDGPSPINLPIWWWGSTICPTNAAIYGGPNFTAWRGDLFMGDCNFRRLHRLDLDLPDYDRVLSDDILWTAPGPILDVESGPDGAIWFTTTSTIYRYYDTARPPNAQFSATPPAATPGTPITFDGSASSDPDGTIVSWTWAFGDTQTGSGPVVSHAYVAPGTYTVTLTVVDNETLSDTATTDVVIEPPPLATFTMNPDPAAPGQAVTFDGTSSSGTITAHDWTFGDGNSATGAIVTHAYPSPGTYAVTLTVTDDRSLQDSETQSLRVNAPPFASFVADPPEAPVGQAVTFNATTSSDPDGAIVSFAWDFGDAQTSAGPVVTHTYVSPGTYTIILTVTDNDGSTDTATTDVIVHPLPFASFTATPSPASPGELVTFDGTGSSGNLTSYQWTFGDGNVASGVIVTHAYASPGSYSVTLTVTDNQSQQDSEIRVLRVNAPPFASFAANPPQTVIGEGVIFDATTSSDPDGMVASYAWSFGDGGTATGAIATHVYSNKGPFVVRLTVTDSDGATNETTRTVLVGNRPPVITFATPAGSTARMVAGESIRFNVTATDPDLDPLTFAWTVDGVPQIGDAPVLVLTGGSPRTYVVNVTVSDGEGTDWREWTLVVGAPSGGAAPWIAGIVLAAVLLLLLFGVWRHRRRRDRVRP